ncbi:MAG TPA: hypothetical protein DIV36_08620, partial [Verrucomicrobiales bacterium]|nr:hypothetical protein [Verrucomicrobiales bacterium]
LFDQGFEAKTNLERDQMAVTNGLLSLEQAKTQFKMLELYDLPKLEETYVSALIEASNELTRVILQGTNTLNKAIADLTTQSNTLRLNKE